MAGAVSALWALRRFYGASAPQGAHAKIQWTVVCDGRIFYPKVRVSIAAPSSPPRLVTQEWFPAPPVSQAPFTGGLSHSHSHSLASGPGTWAACAISTPDEPQETPGRHRTPPSASPEPRPRSWDSWDSTIRWVFRVGLNSPSQLHLRSNHLRGTLSSAKSKFACSRYPFSIDRVL